jgi:hypothetical protein
MLGFERLAPDDRGMFQEDLIPKKDRKILSAFVASADLPSSHASYCSSKILPGSL